MYKLKKTLIMTYIPHEDKEQVEIEKHEALVVNIFSEFLTIDNLIKSGISQTLPDEMELSHFMVLNYFFHLKGEKTPAQLAKTFRVTKGAITNTINKLEQKGYIHSRPDWADGRKKLISLSSTGNSVRQDAIKKMNPLFRDLIKKLGDNKLRSLIPLLREIRLHLSHLSPPINQKKNK